MSIPAEKSRASRPDDGALIAAYIRTGSVWKAASELNLSGQGVHLRLEKLGMVKSINVFTDGERQILREQYEAAVSAGKLADLAASMGRTKHFLCRQARELKLTNRQRTRAWMAEQQSAAVRAWLAVNEHPRGMLGKKHTQATREAVGKAGAERWAVMSEDERAAAIIKQLRGKAMKNAGKLVPDAETRGVSWKQGWREIGGKRVYFRSTWEANYARYLELLKCEGLIVEWEHEPFTFWFEGIKRGSPSYLPDFKVTALDGTVTWHEVKGWMDARSKTKLARMAKYHPEVVMVVVDKDAYRKIQTVYRYTIDGWETPSKAAKPKLRMSVPVESLSR